VAGQLAICGDHALAAIHPPDTAGAILACLGLPARPPPVAPARRSAAPLFEPDPDWSGD
jgi:hypothetical protein